MVDVLESLRKWEFLKQAAIDDANSTEIKAKAALIISLADGSAFPMRMRAMLCHCMARDGVSYMTDMQRVGREQIDGYTDPQGSRLASWYRGTDDCDAKARLFVALARACGLMAEMLSMPSEQEMAAGMGDLAHAYAQVYLPSLIIANGAASEGNPWKWEKIETILSRARVGEIGYNVPVEASGPMKGQRELS